MPVCATCGEERGARSLSRVANVCRMCRKVGRKLGHCSRCGHDGLLQGAALLCVGWCFELCELGHGRVPTGVSRGASAADVEGVVRKNVRDHAHIDFWVVPSGREACLLLAGRVVVWREFGRAAGLLRSPIADDTGRLTRPRGGRELDPRPYAKWLDLESKTPYWPSGDAPILLTKVTRIEFFAVRKVLENELGWAPNSARRLRYCLESLSEYLSAFSLGNYVEAPALCPFVSRVRRCVRRALGAGVVLSGTELQKPGKKGAAFRRGLVPLRAAR